MNSDEIGFLEDQLAASELLYCKECKEDTLPNHLEVLETYPNGAEVLRQCSYCLNV